MKCNREIKTTGDLRLVLADAVRAVINGEMDIEKANSVHKLGKDISDALYSEAKVKMIEFDIGAKIVPLGDIYLGGSTKTKVEE